MKRRPGRPGRTATPMDSLPDHALEGWRRSFLWRAFVL